MHVVRVSFIEKQDLQIAKVIVTAFQQERIARELEEQKKVGPEVAWSQHQSHAPTH